jgi:hypothetical protein
VIRGRESGAGPDALPLDPALACSNRERAVRNLFSPARRTPSDQARRPVAKVQRPVPDSASAPATPSQHPRTAFDTTTSMPGARQGAGSAAQADAKLLIFRV